MTYLHPLYRVGKLRSRVEEVRILHVLDHPLEEGERFVEDDGHRDLGQLFTDAVLQHRPDAEVVPTEHRHGQACPET